MSATNEITAPITIGQNKITAPIEIFRSVIQAPITQPSNAYVLALKMMLSDGVLPEDLPTLEEWLDSLQGAPYQAPEVRHDYVSVPSPDPSVIYCGTAPLGSLVIDSVWTVTRIFVATTGMTTIDSIAAEIAWSDRLTHQYT